MDLLKTPKQLLMEEAGARVDGTSLLNTPRQMLMQESGIVPHFAKGKKVLSPQDMRAEMSVQNTAPKKPADPASHPALAKAWNNLFK
jgi:hypothetical protein